MLYVADEAIINLLLHSDISSVINFFEAFHEFSYLLDNKLFLTDMSVVNNVPTIDNLDQLQQYSVLSDDEKMKMILIKHYYNEDLRLKDLLRMLDVEYNNYNLIAEYAAIGGYFDIIQLMLNLGYTDYDSIMIWAAKGGRIDVVKWMLNLGATNYNQTMALAAGAGFSDIVQLMLDLGATAHSNARITAAMNGHFEIVKWMTELGAVGFFYPYGGKMIVGVDDPEILEYLRQHGA